MFIRVFMTIILNILSEIRVFLLSFCHRRNNLSPGAIREPCPVGQIPCRRPDCYPQQKRCDGEIDCHDDGYDEYNCPIPDGRIQLKGKLTESTCLTGAFLIYDFHHS